MLVWVVGDQKSRKNKLIIGRDSRKVAENKARFEKKSGLKSGGVLI